MCYFATTTSINVDNISQTTSTIRFCQVFIPSYIVKWVLSLVILAIVGPTMDLAYGNYGECQLQIKNIRLYNGSKIVSKEEYINEKTYKC